mgnify:CR=1 FL=1
MKTEQSKQLTNIIERLYKIFREDNHYHFEKGNIKIDVNIISFIEEYIPNGLGLNTCNRKIRIVEERNPLKEEFSDEVVAFRYYDRKEVFLDEEEFTTKKYNYSKKIYLGKRITYEEVLEQGLINPNILPLVNTENIENNSSVILCKNGIIITSPEDNSITLEELKQSKTLTFKV